MHNIKLKKKKVSVGQSFTWIKQQSSCTFGNIACLINMNSGKENRKYIKFCVV